MQSAPFASLFAGMNILCAVAIAQIGLAQELG
jgi:hypothetical protein